MARKHTIATVVMRSSRQGSNASRLDDLAAIVGERHADVFIFPAGYFHAGQKRAEQLYGWAERRISRCAQDAVICCGIDGRSSKPWPKDQTAVAVRADGIIAAARKFYPAPTEKGITLAKHHTACEPGLPRTFLANAKQHYLAVCYDVFGLRHKNTMNDCVDAILNLVHAFFPAQEGNCGENYFARHGFAGASKQWHCPVFGAAVFFRRHIPPNWPSGVMWKLGAESTMKWSYADNSIKPHMTQRVRTSEGCAHVSFYSIEGIARRSP